MSEDSGDKVQSSKKLREIDEEIAAYFRSISKARWPLIEQHWTDQRTKRKELNQKLKSLLSKDDLDILGIEL